MMVEEMVRVGAQEPSISRCCTFLSVGAHHKSSLWILIGEDVVVPRVSPSESLLVVLARIMACVVAVAAATIATVNHLFCDVPGGDRAAVMFW